MLEQCIYKKERLFSCEFDKKFLHITVYSYFLSLSHYHSIYIFLGSLSLSIYLSISLSFYISVSLSPLLLFLFYSPSLSLYLSLPNFYYRSHQRKSILKFICFVNENDLVMKLRTWTIKRYYLLILSFFLGAELLYDSPLVSVRVKEWKSERMKECNWLRAEHSL